MSQRVRGLRAGADDWITKPTHPEEVLARVEAVIRRRKRSSDRSDVGPLVAGELEIRADQFQAFVGGRSIDLTRREFELLELLAQAQGKVLQREEIYQAVWGYAMAHGDRSVDVFVRKLRQKLETASPDWSYIHTHFGVGYRFQPERPGGPDEAAAFEASLGQQAEVPAPPSRPEAEHRRAGRARGACLSTTSYLSAPHVQEPAHWADRGGGRRRCARLRDREPGRRMTTADNAVADDRHDQRRTETGTETEATPAPAQAGGHEDRHPRRQARR